MSLVVVIRVDDEVVHCRTVSGEPHEVPLDQVLGEPEALLLADLDDDGILLMHDPPRVAVRCQVVAIGAPDNPNPRVRIQGLPGPPIEFAVADLGLADYRQAQLTERLPYLMVDPATRPPGHWDHDAGLEDWLAERAARHAAEALAARARQAAARAEAFRNRPLDHWNRLFVNPYTFVPFPDGPCVREAPVGHNRLQADRLAGSIEVMWEAVTPLLVRGPEIGGIVRFPTRPHMGIETPIVPGSSVKGAVRALHETLAGGCLRVVDTDYVPSYRDPATTKGPSWTLGRVEKADPADGRPLVVTLCEDADVVWVMATDLHTVLGGANGLRTGRQFDIDMATATIETDATARRRELRGRTGLQRGQGWVVLVTDSGARSDQHPYWCATGRLSATRTAGVTDAAWDAYQQAVDGSNDVRLAGDNAGQSVQTPVIFPKRGEQVIGHRRTAARRFEVGDVIWARPAGGRIEEVALSALWRRPGEHRLGLRVPDGPDGLLPCSSPKSLCVSCRIFGSADPTGDQAQGAGPARQDAYRGHIRFGDAIAEPGATIEVIPVAPLGTPKPGAGQFYLRHPAALPAPRQGERPQREWGAAADTPSPRQVMGRKYYWHGDPTMQDPPRHKARPHQPQALLTDAEIAGAGTKLACHIVFENLTRVELGGLLAALDPARALHDEVPPGWESTPDVAGRLGGGKPLGLGSVKVIDLVLTIHSAAERYGPGATDPAQPPRAQDLVEEFRESVPPSVRAIWPDLAAVLDRGHVKPEVIWYPPARPWTEAGNRNFEPGFPFWRRSATHFMEDGMTLSPPRDTDQYLEIVQGN